MWHSKANLPSKICCSCKLPFNWRKKWEKNWVGWREYKRGKNWKEMPGFASMNTLENYNKLPYFYWNAKTKMNCLKHALGPKSYWCVCTPHPALDGDRKFRTAHTNASWWSGRMVSWRLDWCDWMSSNAEHARDVTICRWWHHRNKTICLIEKLY